jgi:voltage-gated potassium channel
MSDGTESAVGRYGQAKVRVQEVLTGVASDTFGRIVMFSLIGLILLNVLAVMAESVAWIKADYGNWLAGFEIFSVTVFVIEYMLRLWSCTANRRFRGPVLGRLRFALTPLAIVDLLAVLPTLLLWAGVDLRFLRLVRLARLMRLAKLGRYSRALQAIWQVVRGKRAELLMALMWMAVLLIMASSIMYMAENEQQPEAFSSIPAAMWWGIITLTTVGYGDIYPITTLGKLTAAVIAVVGIGLFALPAGILGSAFVELREQQKAERESVCPHCGKPVMDGRVEHDG